VKLVPFPISTMLDRLWIEVTIFRGKRRSAF